MSVDEPAFYKACSEVMGVADKQIVCACRMAHLKKLDKKFKQNSQK